MVASNHTYRLQRETGNRTLLALQLAERVTQFFDQYPQISREEFFLSAIQREMDARARDNGGIRRVNSRLEGRPVDRWHVDRRPSTTEDVRLHAWLIGRLVLLHEQRTWWARVRRSLYRWWIAIRFP